MRVPYVPPNLLDKIITYVNPSAGIERNRARTFLAMTGSHTGARKDRRQTTSMGASPGSSDADDLDDIKTLTPRSRELYRNAPLARGAISTVVTSVVGVGLTAHSRVDRDVLIGIAGNSDEELDALERSIEREFNFWANSTLCDVTKTSEFSGLQDLVMRSALVSGDSFCLRRYIDSSDRYGTKIQILEADRIANPLGTMDKPELAGGVFRDEFGAPVAYRVLKNHPGDLLGNKTEFDKVPAFGESGLRLMMHLFFRDRPGQTRGLPFLAPVIETLKQLDQYREAELMAAVVGAMYTVFIKTENGESMAPMTPSSELRSNSNDGDYKLAPGAVLDLAQGEDVVVAQPGRPNVAFDGFVTSILSQIGVALEIPFELLIKHFTSSYTAAQAAFGEAWKFFNSRRKWFVSGFCKPVYEAVIWEAVAKGYINAPGFMSDAMLRAAYLGCEWIGPPRGQINQLVEVKAAKERVDMGASTLEQETAGMTGGNWERNHNQSVKEHKARLQAGMIPPVSVPGAPTDPLTAAQGN